MKFSSSALRALCASLAAVLFLEWSGMAVPCRAEGREPVLLLKYSAASISDEDARKRFSPVIEEIEKRLDVHAALTARGRGDLGPVLAEIDDSTLKDISIRVSEASRRMDRLENREAERALSGIEKEMRKYRFGDATRPILADVCLKLGTLSIWNGNKEAALASFRKARSLEPGFEPDPALHSPQFRQLWAETGKGAAAEAEILFESVPQGARVFIDNADKGVTPRRIRVPASRPVRVRLEHPGYQASVGTRQWLVGDTERVEVLLSGDRESRLAGFFEANGSEIREAGPIVSEMAKEAGVEKLAFLMLGRRDGVPELRVLSASASSPEPRLLGTVRFPEDEKGYSSNASRITALLAEAGWPSKTAGKKAQERPWYYSWWLLTGVGLLAAGAAAALSGGGGGGGGGTSTSPTSVSF